MALKYNNTEVQNVTYNGQEVQKVVYNGTTVWEAGKWYPVQYEDYNGILYDYAPVTLNFDAITDDIFNFQQVATAISYNRTSPKKYKMSGTITYISSGTTKTKVFTDAIIETADGSGGIITTFEYANLELVISNVGSVYIGTTNGSTALYATKLAIASFEEYR